MILNRTKVFLRNSLKPKQSLFINLIGLSIGFAMIIAIAFFIQEEKKYNQFHEKINDLYCVFTLEPSSNDPAGWHETVPALPKAMRSEYPEIIDAALFRNGTTNMLIQYENNKNYENIQLADPNLFNMFSFPIVLGHIPNETTETHIIAISEKMAAKYFGTNNPIGKPITIDNKDIFNVVAVFKDMPKNSSIHFDFWIPIELIAEQSPGHLDTWYNLSFQAYALLEPGASFTEVNKKLLNRIQQSNPDSKDKASLYPFSKLYLGKYGHDKNIKSMSLIGLIVILLVCLNFVNLQSAEVYKRIKQIGIKKINGASTFNISLQLFLESFLLSFLALLFGMLICYIGKPYLLQLINKPNAVGSLLTGFSISIVSTCVIVISFISGIVPAMSIRSVSPINSLKEKISEKISVKKFRHVLSAIQFCLAIVLLICLMVTTKQVRYLQNKDLGFNKEQLLYIRLDGELYDKRDVLQQKLNQYAGISNTSLSSHSPIGIYWNGGGWDWKGKESGYDPQVTYIETDKNFIKTFGIEMAQGDYYESETPGVVINKTFAQMISPGENALGKLLINENQGLKIPVKGIIEDIHFKPLDRKIGALMFIPQMGIQNMKYIFIRINPSNMLQTLDFIENTVTELNPDFPYFHHFLDEDFARLYKKEQIFRSQMTFFSFLAIIISCMGLWGIMVFIVKERVKEIGIRKVNGAKVSEVLMTLNKDFVKWIAIAFVIATPIAYYAMNKWLENFAYKTELSWWIFALAGLLALGIALLTVSWQSWRAATRNPVEALRSE